MGLEVIEQTFGGGAVRIALIAFYKLGRLIAASGIACFTTMGAGALANDSSAEIATGGLVFVKNPNVEMRSEDLYISTAEIRVRYRFFNKSNVDITTVVAFPLPDITRDLDSPLTIPTDDPVNLFGFTTTVEGQQIRANVEQKAYARDRDQTNILARLNVPLAPHLVATQKALDALSAGDKDRLKALYLIDDDLAPLWTLKTTFYWKQLFAAGHETIIEHSYKPSVGGSAATNLGADQNQREYQKYCPEPSLLNSLKRATSGWSDQISLAFSEERIEYILKTGANWAGPINDFRLIVDKGKPTNMVSFCGDGVKQISPTQFEIRATNFIPEENISILILVKNEDYSPSPTAPTAERRYSPPTDKFTPGGLPTVSGNKFNSEEPVAPTNSNNEDSYYFVANTRPPDAYLALRTQPSSSRGQRITTMPNGTLLEILQRQVNGWWHVRVVATGQEGWALAGEGNRVWLKCCQTLRAPKEVQEGNEKTKQDSDNTIVGVARSASLFLGFFSACANVFKLNEDRTKKYWSAYVGIGNDTFGSNFNPVYEQEMTRRANEIKITGREQWCIYQQAYLQKIGIKDIFRK